MYSRILVPLDGSEVAEQVLPYVRLLGQGLKAHVELFQLFDPSLQAVLAASHGGEPLSVKRRDAQNHLEKVATSLKKDGLDVSVNLYEAPVALPAVYILSEAEKEPSTLIALSTHGRFGIGRWLLGSTTDKVLQATKNPLLIIRSRGEEEFSQEVKLDSITVALDGSTLAEQVLAHVVALAQTLSLKVILVRVTPWGYTGFSDDEPIPRHQPPTEPDPDAVEYLTEVSDRLRQEGVSSVEERVLYGAPDELILETAREIRNSLVAITTHGRSGIGRWLFGSVADRVVRYCGCPVLVIRAVQDSS